MLKMNIKQSADDTLDIEELDYVGNVVLIVESESPNTARFLVSSKVLELASLYLQHSFRKISQRVAG